MIILAILAAWAVSICSMTDANVQIAENQQKASMALASAESGLDVLRFWVGRVYLPGDTAQNERFTRMATHLQDNLSENGISNIPISIDINVISIADQANPVLLKSSSGQGFSAKIRPTDNINLLQMDVTGYTGGIKRTIRVNYNFGTRAHTVFDYGIATKGPLALQGSAEIDGYIDLDAGVYIESESNPALEIIGNSHIAGDVDFTNPDANVILGNKASIGGETGQAAIDNHCEFGVPAVDFPVPIPTYFEHYVTSTYDPNNPEEEYENVRIPAESNPTFNSNMELKGVIFIEVPNIVTFAGNTTIIGIIVGNGSLSDNSGTNIISFLGTVDSYPVTDLPDEPQFAELKNETGTFLLAPGFTTYFGGDFETINGAIAANGITFGGNAGGTIAGSVINYSPQLMDLFGNTNLIFNRSGTTEIPAGFGPEIILNYLPESYCEVIPNI